MLFDCLLVACVLYLMALPFVVVNIIAYGMKLAENGEKKPVEAFVKLPRVLGGKAKRDEKRRNAEQEEQIRRINSVMANIDKYDGTGNGQEEIK